MNTMLCLRNAAKSMIDPCQANNSSYVIKDLTIYFSITNYITPKIMI